MEQKNNRFSLNFNKFNCAIVFFLASFIIEIGTFIYLGFGIFPKYFMLDFFVVFTISSIILFVPYISLKIFITLFFLILQAMISYVNVTLYTIYGDLFSFDLIVQCADAFGVFDISFIRWGFISFLLLTIGISSYFIFTSLKDYSKLKNKNKNTFKNKTATIFLIMFIFSLAFGFSGYNAQLTLLHENNSSEYDKYFNNDKTMYEKLFIKSESLKRFGYYGYYTKNLINLLTDKKEYNYDLLIDYISSPVYQTNNKTGILQGDNVIVLMCESLEWYAINPILTPTLNSLFNYGVTFTNYISRNKTNYSEMAAILGSISTDDMFTFTWHSSSSKLLGNTYPFTLPNKLKANGYDKARFFHNHFGSFYSRKKTHTTFGFDEIITLEDMDISDKADGLIGHTGSYTRDSDMIKSCINKIAPKNEKFFSYISTMTSHGPYKKSNKLEHFYLELENGKLDEYILWLEQNTNFKYPHESEEYKQYLKYYLATVMDLDRGVKYLLDYLAQNNMQNNTTIVLFSDHNAYYQDLAFKIRDVNKKEYYNPDYYIVPFTIYSPKLQSEIIDKFTCPFNIAPTILDLLGVTFNNKLYMGYSVFNENYSDTIFVSQIGGIMNDYIYSDDNIKLYSKKNLTEEEINDFKQKVVKYFIKQDYLNQIYSSNIFGKFPELMQYC